MLQASRLKLAENEIDALKNELTVSKMEARKSESKSAETIQHWQTKVRGEYSLLRN